MPTSEMTLWEAIMNIRGEPGTEVVLTMEREGEEELIDIPITRAAITIPSVEVSFIEQNDKTLAHVAVYQFAENTYYEFYQALQAITLEGADGLVLDMRLNGGGYLDVSVEILSEFFEDEVKGVIVKRRDHQLQESMYTHGDGYLPELPLVVLIDEGSASAAEIVAGALQDHERAVIMGEQSFGKGSVQELSGLMDGSSLRLTIARWYTPDDRSIDESGITPDIIIDMEVAAIDNDDDLQLHSAFDYLADL